MNSRILSILACLLTLMLAAPATAQARSPATAWVSSNHIQVIDIDSGRVVGRLPLKEFIHEMQFSGDGARLFVGTSKALRIVDADRMEFTEVLANRTTKAVAVSKDGTVVAAVHPGDPKDSQRARKAGTPLPMATLTLYSGTPLRAIRSWPVPAMTFDVVLSPAADRVYVLDATGGKIDSYDLEGKLAESLPIVPTDGEGRPQRAMLGWMALSPNGSALVVPVTTATGALLAEVDLAADRSGEGHIKHTPLETRGRVQGLAWNEPGDTVLITAVGALCHWSEQAGKQVWKTLPVNYVDIEPVPGSSDSVVVAPVFSEKNKSGGVSVVSADGEVLRSIELLDMSPFFVAVRP